MALPSLHMKEKKIYEKKKEEIRANINEAKKKRKTKN